MSRIADYGVPDLATFYTASAIPNAPKHTGRLPLSGKEETLAVPPSVLFAPEPYLTPDNISEQIQYRHSDTPLNKLFFSQGNIDTLQGEIQSTVQQMVGATISRQSDSDLLMVMRSYYLQYAQNNPARLAEELSDLNQRVIGFCANRISVEVEAYRYYRKDIMDFPAPIANPMNVKKYGSMPGELRSFF